MKNLVLVIILLVSVSTFAQGDGDKTTSAKNEDLRVLLYDEEGRTQQVQYSKNEEGEFEFNNLRPGNYQVGLALNKDSGSNIYISEKRCETGLGTIVLNYEWSSTTDRPNSREQRVNICKD